MPDFQHEGRIFDPLQTFLGTMIPFYLGNIVLARASRDLHVQLTHMLLMSWVEERADKVDDVRDIDSQTKQFEIRIERLRVKHNDLILANIRWSDQLRNVILIDFEAARETPREALRELSSNRK